MGTVDELKAKLATLVEQLATLTAEKVQVEADLKDAERAFKQSALNEILEKMKKEAEGCSGQKNSRKQLK